MQAAHLLQVGDPRAQVACGWRRREVAVSAGRRVSHAVYALAQARWCIWFVPTPLAAVLCSPRACARRPSGAHCSLHTLGALVVICNS